MNRIELLAGDVDELHRRRVLRLGQRIGFVELPGVLEGRLRAAVLQEAAIEHQVSEGLCAEHGGITFRHLALVAGRQEQILAALPLVRTGIAEVAHILEPVVIDDAEDVRWCFEHQRTVADIQPRHMVNALGIGGQEERLRVHQVFHDEQGLVVDRPLAGPADTDSFSRRTRHRVEKGLYAAHEVEVVVDFLRGGIVGNTIEEF